MRMMRNALLCGVMAAAVMLSGCSKKFNVKSSKPAVIEDFDGNVADVSPKSGDLVATFEIEGYGEIKAVLFSEAAPVGVENFQKLCDAGFYKGLKIHRVRGNFMFQGGSLNGDGTGGDAMVKDGDFDIETAQNARHFYGALCYANAGGKNSTQFYIVNSKNPQTIDTSDADLITNSINQRLDDLNENAKSYGENYKNHVLYEIQYDQNTLDFKTYATDEVKARYQKVGGYAPLDGNYTVFGQVYEGFDVVDAISAVEVEENDSGEKSRPVKDIIIKDVSVSVFE